MVTKVEAKHGAWLTRSSQSMLLSTDDDGSDEDDKDGDDDGDSDDGGDMMVI